MKTNIFGISTEERADWRNDFEVISDDPNECVILQSKQVFKHEDDEPFNFRYRYFIEAQRTEDDKWYYSLYMVPVLKDMCESIRHSIISCSGIDEEDATELDAYYCGYSLLFGNTQRGEGDECDYSVLDEIATIYSTIDRMRGFWLDKPQTRLGSNGWDRLEHLLTGKDEFKRVFDEYEKSKSA